MSLKGLSKKRIINAGNTHYPWEREAIDWIIANLPDVDPYYVWPLQEFTDPSTGRLYDADILILGKHVIYYVEIKSYPGIVRGDASDWYIYDSSTGRTKTKANPYSLTNTKAKCLKSMLDRQLSGSGHVRIEALVFLSHPEVDNKLEPRLHPRVVTRANFVEAITHGVMLDETLRRTTINRPMMRAVIGGLGKTSLRGSANTRLVGEYRLSELLNEGEGYQEHRGVHQSLDTKFRRIRTYLVPHATSTERQSQLKRAAHREAVLLLELGDHPTILKHFDYHEDAPLGPALSFELFEGALPLDTFIKSATDQKVALDDKLEILQHLAETLHFCHQRRVLHRNLEPNNILVRRDAEGKLEVRIHRFHLAMHEEGTRGTVHFTSMSASTSELYRAPEVLEDPTQAQPSSDVFSLGAIAYFLLSGEAPGASQQERDNRLMQGGLRLTDITDEYPDDVSRVIEEATSYAELHRPENPVEWYDQLYAALFEAQNEQPDASLDPIDAKKGEQLTNGYLVDRRLGSGTTALALKVMAEDTNFYALKVPHDAGCAERLRDEHKILLQLDHANIVKSFGIKTIRERDCLLLEFAGEESLRGVLRIEGALSLEYARRYGIDLLNALRHLESHGIQHRDLKPSNIGISHPADKKAKRLKVFDFSLSSIEPKAISAGTAAYRDPFLRMRGQWDHAADRYAAALILYEMLTGSSPRISESSSGQKSVFIDAEHFDATVREQLTQFFSRCFNADLSDRYPSADAMEAAWEKALEEELARPAAQGIDAKPTKTTTRFGDSTPIAALRLSNRAINALDRAGVLSVGDLVRLPRNQLSAIRGAGRKVAQEIQSVAEWARRELTLEPAAASEAFAPHYKGNNARLRIGGELGLTKDQYHRLIDAGIKTKIDLAQAANNRIEQLLEASSTKQLRENLLAVQEATNEGNLETWLAELLNTEATKVSKPERQVRMYLGYGPMAGSTGRTLRRAADVALNFGVSAANIFRNVKKQADERWITSDAWPALQSAVFEMLDAHQGLLSWEEACIDLGHRHRASSSAIDDALEQAHILLRIVVEMGKLSAEGPRLKRINDAPWLESAPGLLELGEELGRKADELAQAEPLPSTPAVKEALSAIVADSQLGELRFDILARLAVKLSRHAALSSRLELYPKNLSADRVLKLSNALLTTREINPDELIRRVAQRYPDAQSLPSRPKLDALVEPYQFYYSDQVNQYQRSDQFQSTQSGTIAMPPRLPSAQPHEPRRHDPLAEEGNAFKSAMETTLDSGRFRVIQTPVDEAEFAIPALRDHFSLTVSSLDRDIWEVLKRQCDADGINMDTIIETDLAGPDGEDWANLVDVMQDATKTLVHSYLSQRESPRLLIHPGILARFALDEILQELVDRADVEEGAAIFLMVPSHDDNSAPSINNRLPVPAFKASQKLRFSRHWYTNQHGAAAHTVVGDADAHAAFLRQNAQSGTPS